LRDFLGIAGLSIGVSLMATAFATAVALPGGTALAIYPFRGRRWVVVLINALFGLPPVVVGLILYLALSRSGPLGFLRLLFTPAAMVIAQAILAIPIIAALVHRAGERAWARYGDELICDGASRLQAIPPILAIIRAELLTAVLAGFGRTISEVGAVILVGGNIRGLTRTMTTAIALQTNQGDLPLALALGAVLVGISISVSATVFALAGPARAAGSDEV
jgi:tungstate transport system permease protein